MKIKKSFVIISIISTLMYVYVACMDAPKPAEDARGQAYAGSASCQKCHQGIVDSYKDNEHFHTSWSVHNFPKDIKVSLDSFIYNERSKVVIEHRDSGIFQVAYLNGQEVNARKFSIGFGSGEKAYTFGYWEGKKLNQLPLSYFTTIHQWANSPGFPAHAAYFDRPIIRRCMECHSSYIAAAVAQTESFSNVRNMDSNTLILGIDCERCHGPAADHVKFQTANPDSKESRYIASWKILTRQQRLDACGVCHSGNDLETQLTLFAFQPGDTLSRFFYPEFGQTAKSPDVHGKQVQLLSASKCFIQSENMDCNTCHSLHQQKTTDLNIYTQKCQQCHKDFKHTDPAVVSVSQPMITENCIACHMPKVASNVISFREKGKEEQSDYLLRTHRIAIYPEETRKILSLITNP